MSAPALMLSDVPDAIYARLKEQILSGALGGGEQIKIQLVADEMGVSIVPVREAIRMLAAEGLIELRPRRSPVVATLELSEVLEVTTLRQALEPFYLELAIPNHTPDTLSACLALIRADQTTTDYSEKVDLNRQFHLALLAPCNQPHALKLIGEQFESIARYGQMLVLRGQTTLQGHVHNEHLDIIKAIQQGQSETAITLLRQHIAAAGRRIEAELELQASFAPTEQAI